MGKMTHIAKKLKLYQLISIFLNSYSPRFPAWLCHRFSKSAFTPRPFWLGFPNSR